MTTPPDRPRAPRQRLPITLLVLAGLMLLKAVLLIALVSGATLIYFSPVDLEIPLEEDLTALASVPMIGLLVVLAAVLVILSVVGLLLRRRGGWLLAMVMTGLFIAGDIYNFTTGTANHFWMILNIVSVFYLNQQDVREVVGAARSRPDLAETEPGVVGA